MHQSSPIRALSLTVLLTFVVPMASQQLPDVADFFPEINSDIKDLIWGHAINSNEKLIAAIEGPDMMLEADVVMGTTTNSTVVVPIMAHPPHSSSDLTFDRFLGTVINVNDLKKRKGIKLDLKDSSVLDLVLSRLRTEFDAGRLNFPVWLNADVIKGPIDASPPTIGAVEFVTKGKRYLAAATLSLGWTTKYEHEDLVIGDAKKQLSTIVAKGYTLQNVREMLYLLETNPWDGPVTFAVRAMFLAPENSRNHLSKLMETEQEGEKARTFTIWSALDDPVDKRVLLNWVLVTQKGRVYIDLPFDLYPGYILFRSTCAGLALPFLFIITIVVTVMFAIAVWLFCGN